VVKPELPDSPEAIRRRIRRRVRRFTLGALIAATGTAVGGGALVAWLLRPAGLPLAETWAISGVLILGIPLVGHGLRYWRERRSRARGERGRAGRWDEPR